MKRIPIQNNNSNNGKKLSAGEEVEADKITEEIRQYTSKQNPFATPSLRNCGDANTFTENIKRALEESTEDQEEVPVGDYFDAKTYNQKDMKEYYKNYQVLGFLLVIIALLIALLFAMFSPESEAEKAGRIAELDYKRQEQLKENEKTRQATIDCDLAITNEMGKDKEIVPCTARTHSGATLVPKANAMESIEVKETGDRGVGIKDADVDCLKSFTNEQNQYNCFQSGASYVRNGKDSWGKPSQYFLDWKKNRTNSGTVTTAISVVPSGFQRTRKDEVIMENICSAAPNSPICGKWDLYARLQDITLTRLPEAKYGRMWEILLGITYAESHIGQNYAKDKVGGSCVGRFNMGGTKYQILDNNKREHSRQMNGFNYGVEFHSRYEDQYGCNLYPFQSYEEYWETKVNGMRYGWHRCILGNPQPITCMANGGYLTGNKANWIKNVASFLVTDEMLSMGQP